MVTMETVQALWDCVRLFAVIFYRKNRFSWHISRLLCIRDLAEEREMCASISASLNCDPRWIEFEEFYWKTRFVGGVSDGVLRLQGNSGVGEVGRLLQDREADFLSECRKNGTSKAV
jgi:hypothetical protein